MGFTLPTPSQMSVLDILLFLVLVTLLGGVIAYATVTTFVPRFLVVPPHNWREVLGQTLDSPKPVYVKTGLKEAAYRRWLILGSQNPSFYSTHATNRVRVGPVDLTNKTEFLEAVKPHHPDDPSRRRIFGFFHPYAHAAGGGERVLWEAVKETLASDAKAIVAIYTGDIGIAPEQIVANAADRFHITTLDEKRIVFIYLKYRRLINASHWPRFTLIGQALGTVLLTAEAMYRLAPDMWCDTIGLPFGYPLVGLGLQIPIISYVHYPVISSDMLLKLGSLPKEVGKYLYWSAFKYIYTRMGPFVDIVMTNSTWTHNHMAAVWHLNPSVQTVYPPCGTEELARRIAPAPDRENCVLRIAQFRPEKRDALVLSEYARFFHQTQSRDPPRLVLLGSTRGKDDEMLVEGLRTQAAVLGIASQVEFVVNAPYPEMVRWLERSRYGLNAMWNEHFGIAVVEYLASGCIPVVHASAGPLADIVVPWNEHTHEPAPNQPAHQTGFFFRAKEDPDYPGHAVVDKTTGEAVVFPALNEVFETLCHLLASEVARLSARGRDLALHKFSNTEFDEKWRQVLVQGRALEGLKRKLRSTVEQVY